MLDACISFSKKKHWRKTSVQAREYSAFYQYKKWNNLQHKISDQAFLVLFNVENQITPLFSSHSQYRGGEGGVGVGVEVFCLGYVPTIPWISYRIGLLQSWAVPISKMECHILDK